MWVLFVLSLCLLVTRITKWDLVRARKFFQHMSFVQMVLIVPQPMYYIVGEIIKLSGDYSDLFYPNKGEFVAQLLFILVLYLPSAALYYMNRRMIKTCILRVHPNYDFETHELYIAKPVKSG